MTRRCTVPSVLVLFLAFAAAAVADPPSGLDGRIGIALKGADARQVLASFGAILGREASIDPEVTGTLTIELHGVRAATALTAACESLGCVWSIEDGVLRVRRDPGAPATVPAAAPSDAEAPRGLDNPIDMQLRDAGLRETLRAFAAIAGVPVEVDEALGGKVTIDLHNTPARKALDALCDTHDCRWSIVDTPDGPVLRVTPR